MDSYVWSLDSWLYTSKLWTGCCCWGGVCAVFEPFGKPVACPGACRRVPWARPRAPAFTTDQRMRFNMITVCDARSACYGHGRGFALEATFTTAQHMGFGRVASRQLSRTPCATGLVYCSAVSAVLTSPASCGAQSSTCVPRSLRSAFSGLKAHLESDLHNDQHRTRPAPPGLAWHSETKQSKRSARLNDLHAHDGGDHFEVGLRRQLPCSVAAGAVRDVLLKSATRQTTRDLPTRA